MKGLIERQHGCLETAMVWGRGEEAKSRGGNVNCSYWQRTNNIQGIVLMQVGINFC